MKVLRATILLTVVMMAWNVLAYAYEWPPVEDSVAYKKYLKRHTKTDLSRLIYLLDRFNFEGMEIRVDGVTFQAPMCVPFVKAYLALNYRKEKAEEWVQKHVYRSPFTNQIMHGRLPGEDFKPGRDLLLAELAKLREVEAA